MSPMPNHVLMALKVPKWFIKAVDKIRRRFRFWCGRGNANGGCCLVAWEKVQRPLDLGGLGIIIWRSWVGLYKLVGYGFVKSNRVDPGMDWISPFILMP
ncbi:hypothetical protein PR202_gb03457 [Eleusine coracana subsp. coracana]|uniref:Uncharacterized protein n=1 Tax=Eleusine coracana subsp. coracana TaxID=191504 RepID=A0AAV5E1V4_ELECO|nr:hypothetical protein PR202_gb03457 [Eleusine coracana subsp. coracana]